jgi:hypothetical protein
VGVVLLEMEKGVAVSAGVDSFEKLSRTIFSPLNNGVGVLVLL